jgi:hypothetical protein
MKRAKSDWYQFTLLQNTQTGPEAHLFPLSTDTNFCPPGEKQLGDEDGHSYARIAKVKNEES